MSILTRRLEPDEVELHRELRLQALQDSPGSFRETFSEAVARPISYWQELSRSVSEAGAHVMFLALEDSYPIGSVYGLRDRERSDTGRVGGMWVRSESRRQGVGRALLSEIFDWARQCSFRQLALWAPAQSHAAASLYHRVGFRETGNRRPFANDALVEIVEMCVEL
jgi:GNAT superfamily N-acetyltransferase